MKSPLRAVILTSIAYGVLGYLVGWFAVLFLHNYGLI